MGEDSDKMETYIKCAKPGSSFLLTHYVLTGEQEYGKEKIGSKDAIDTKDVKKKKDLKETKDSKNKKDSTLKKDSMKEEQQIGKQLLF